MCRDVGEASLALPEAPPVPPNPSRTPNPSPNPNPNPNPSPSPSLGPNPSQALPLSPYAISPYISPYLPYLPVSPL